MFYGILFSNQNLVTKGLASQADGVCTHGYAWDPYTRGLRGVEKLRHVVKSHRVSYNSSGQTC